MLPAATSYHRRGNLQEVLFVASPDEEHRQHHPSCAKPSQPVPTEDPLHVALPAFTDSWQGRAERLPKRVTITSADKVDTDLSDFTMTFTAWPRQPQCLFNPQICVSRFRLRAYLCLPLRLSEVTGLQHGRGDLGTKEIKFLDVMPRVLPAYAQGYC